MKSAVVNITLRGDIMKIGISTKGDFKNTEAWLKRASTRSPSSALKTLGSQGVSSLAAATPTRTGATAAGWKSKVEKTGSGYDLIWYNTSHPETSANVAMLLQMGHGTGTGGYVPGQDYINPALRPIFAIAGDKLVRELIK